MLLIGLDYPERQRQDPQALPTHTGVGLVDSGDGLSDRNETTVSCDRLRAAAYDDVGGTFGEEDHPILALVGDTVDSRHELVVRVEGHLGKTGVGPAGFIRRYTELRRQYDQSSLGGIADNVAVVADCRIAVQHQGVGHRGEIVVIDPGNGSNVTGLFVTAAADFVPTAGVKDETGHHLIHREGARLVCVDCARRAESLYVGEILDNGFGVGKLTGPVGEHPLNKCGESGGNR